MPIGGGSGGGGAGIRAGRAFVEMTLNDNMLLRGLEKLRARIKSFGVFLTKTGGLLTGLGLASLSPLKFAVDTLNDLARQGQTAKALGLTAEQFTGVAGVAASAGEQTREFIESLVTLGKVVSEGVAGKGEVAATFFERLGVAATEFQGLRPDEQFFKVFDALSKVENKADRVRLLMIAFGEDGGKYLLPLLSKTQDELKEMAALFSVSQEEVDAAAEAQLQYMFATMGLKRVWQQVSVAVAPTILEFANLIRDAVGPMVEFVKQNRELIGRAVLVASGVLAAGIALTAFGLAAQGAAAAIGLFFGILAVGKFLLLSLLTPLGLLTAAAIALGVAWATMTPEGLNFIDTMKGGFMELLGTFKMAWGGIIGAMQSGDFQLAGQIAFTALKLEWAKVILFWTDKWNQFKGFFVDGWHDAVKLVALALVDLGTAFNKLIDQIISGFASAFHAILFQLRGVLDKLAGLTIKGVPLVPGAADAAGLILELEKQLLPLLGAGSDRDKRADDIKNEIEKQARKEQDARTAAREKDLNEAREEIERLKRELEEMSRGGLPGGVPGAAGGLGPFGAGIAEGGLAAAMSRFRVSSVAGGLATPGLGAQFGLKAGSFEKQALDNDKKMIEWQKTTANAVVSIAKNFRWH